MTKGGARNRSGPGKDPGSIRSAQGNVVLSALSADGYDGEVPEFPLPRRGVYRWEWDDKHRFQVFDSESTQEVLEREHELWAWAWTTPQACAWAAEPWRWPTIAMWVRTYVICEGSDAQAADKNGLHRFADQIGLTPAGLSENGWSIAPPKDGGVAATAAAPPGRKSSSRDRMKVRAGAGNST